MKTALMQKRVPRRALVWLCVAALLISLTPLYIISFYNHACYDDLGFSLLTRDAWLDTGSFISTVEAAVRNTTGIRQTWEGTYATSFISALQPALFGEGLYWLTTVILLSFFLISLWIFMRRVLVRLLGADKQAFWMAYCCVAFVLIQFVPDISEAFFWFNGGVAYTLLWSVMLLRFSAWLGYLDEKRRGIKLARYALLLLLTLIVGGGKYSTLLLACLADALFVVEGFIRKRKERLPELIAALLLFACFIFSALAPGNEVRSATLGARLSAPMAVLQAVYFGLSLMGSWFSLPLFVAWALVGWQLAEALRGSPFRFNHPIWITALCVCLFCAQLAPTLYTGNYLGDGRARDTYFYTFVLMSCALALYWEGWYIRRAVRNPSLPAIGTGARSGLRLGALLAAVALLIVGIVSYHPEGSQSYGPQNTASGSAFRSLINGEAARYDEAMDARDAEMNDADKQDAVLTPVIEVPDAFMGDALTGDSLDYVLSLYADYYNKQSVVLSEEDADAAQE